MAQKKRWADLSPEAKAAIVVAGAVETVVTTIALRDLARRPSNGVRGWKVFWFLGMFVQPVGSPLYLMFGRRDTANA